MLKLGDSWLEDIGMESIFCAVSLQVLYQLKLLTTAMFSYLMLGKKFSTIQVASLFVLFLGLALVESDKSEEKSVVREDQNQFLGLVTVILSSLSSGGFRV